MKRPDTTAEPALRRPTRPAARAATVREQRLRPPALSPARRPGQRPADAAAFRQLQELARRHDIQTAYTDMAGQRQEASAEVLKAMLGVLGVPVQSAGDVREALRQIRQRRWQQGVEPVVVAWDERPARIELRLPADQRQRPTQCRVQLEHGEVLHVPCRPERLRTVRTVEVEGRPCVIKHLELPPVPDGYHRFEFETAESTCRSLVISAPTQSYSEPGAPRAWGLFVPMYAARSQSSWGAGDFADMRRLSQWAGSLGAGVIGTLPLLAAFLGHPAVEPSPYSPASRLFWNEFYLDIPSIPEFSRCPRAQQLSGSAQFQKRLEALRESPLIDYREAMAVRREVLERLAGCFFAGKDVARWRALREFVHRRPQVEDYARFRAVCDQLKTGWRQWPEPLRDGRLRRGDYSEALERYHLYVQWQAQEQMAGLLEGCRAQEVKFYLDLPLGVHPDGYDVWRERQAFALDANAGAPPDMFFTKGQDWGFSPLHPQRIREQGYRYVLDFLRFQMRHTGLLRIDHVMGLHRLYWVPQGRPPGEGAYVSYHAEELYALFCLESHRHKTILVGENLGTVPPEVNAGMRRHHLRQTYVVQYEVRPDPKRALRPPPAQSVASLNTHDMPSFQAFWEGRDIEDRAELGLIPKGKLGRERQGRRQLKAALVKFFKRQGCLTGKEPDGAAVLRACLAWLSASRAEIVLVNLEDLWQETLPQNVPGTSRERPNWRRKARFTLEEAQQRPEVWELLEMTNRMRE